MKTWAQKLWPKVRMTDTCWLWTGERASNGYGTIKTKSTGKRVLVHRPAWELSVGPIPAGLVIDHLCRVRNCVNPTHLRVCTRRENVLCGIGPAAVYAARTHCAKGHLLAGDNLIHCTKGPSMNARICKTCKNARRNALKMQNRHASQPQP
jgi:hypothetical protein